MLVGVLALQGDFEAHAEALTRASAHVEVVQVRSAEQLQSLTGLVIPGGESTSMLKLMEYYGLFEPLRLFGSEKPVFGTCAGAILLAREVLNPAQESLGLVDLTVERNAYGRQLDSRVVRLTDHELGGAPELEAVFIRAPIIRRMGEDVRVLARYEGNPVVVEAGRHLIATCHPELSRDPRVHARFVSKIEA